MLTEKQILRQEIEQDIAETARLTGKSTEEIKKLLSGEHALTHSEIRTGASFDEVIQNKRLQKTRKPINQLEEDKGNPLLDVLVHFEEGDGEKVDRLLQPNDYLEPNDYNTSE